MEELHKKKCVPCEGGIPAFDISEIHKYLKRVDGWDVLKDNDDSSDDGESSKNGNTYFLKPYLNTNQKDFGSKYDSFDSVDYKPVEGAVLIWPSHISHGSIPSVGEKNRIIVSANAKIELN